MKAYRILIFLTVVFPCVVNAQNAGKIVHVNGEVRHYSVKEQKWEDAGASTRLYPGDEIKTGEGGRAALLMADESLIQLNGNTHFIVQETAPRAFWVKAAQAAYAGLRSVYHLRYGEIWLRNKSRHAGIDIRGPAMVAGVRGTEINFRADPDGSTVLTVLRGRAAAENELGRLELSPGEQALGARGRPLEKRVLLSPSDAVQWTIAVPRWFAANEAAQERLRSAVIALTRGEKEKALKLADEGVTLDPASADAHLIQGYAWQSLFELEKAMAAFEKALAADPANIRAMIHIATLYFGMGFPEKAHNIMAHAEQIAPRSADVLSLKGFLLLALRKTDEAVSTFEQAASYDSGLGDPHMGLGVAFMRKGDDVRAMEEISTAVLLEPQRSIFLSYWAKMLYQLKRFDEALDMLEVAAELDPRDPTPALYKGVILRDLHRNDEAIAALHEAIALNDNRAVYRSRYLLDGDLAVKNVNLFILYKQLGLSAWARSKAVSSVKQDYANFAGHLFLGSALLESGNRTIAGGSELLLARILQPANGNAVNEFNEYTSFFETPGVNGTIYGGAGNHDAYGGGVIGYGAMPRFNVAFSADASAASTDGWRDVNHDEYQGVAALVKYDPTIRDGVYMSARYLERDQGDKAYPRNEYDDPADPLNSREYDYAVAELGYCHHFSPTSASLLFFTWDEMQGLEYSHFRQDDFPRPGAVYEVFGESDYRRPYYQMQGQHIFRWQNHQFIVGGLFYKDKNELEDAFTETVAFRNAEIGPFVTTTDAEQSQELQSWYIQDIWRPGAGWTLEFAAYYDRMDNSNVYSDTEWTIEEFSPRAGVIWQPTPSDAFRLAGFKYVLPFTANRIDPMDIGGVPIFRNTGEGSAAEEADLSWEHEWRTGFLLAGLFYLDREYAEKLPDGVMETMKSRVKGAETELNQLLGNGMALAAGYQFKDIDDAAFPENERYDQQAKIALNWVHHSGFMASVSETWRYTDFKSGLRDNEDIWITDVGFAYDFPGRRGTLGLAVNNVFDSRFNWVEDQFDFYGRAPAREIYVSASLNF